MFLTNKVNLSFDDGLDFEVEVPNNAEMTPLYSTIQELFEDPKAITLEKLQPLAEAIGKKVTKFPELWDCFPEQTQTRLLFEIAKYITSESLRIPDLKKK